MGYYPLEMTNIALEHGHRNHEFCHEKNIMIFHSESLLEGTIRSRTPAGRGQPWVAPRRRRPWMAPGRQQRPRVLQRCQRSGHIMGFSELSGIFWVFLGIFLGLSGKIDGMFDLLWGCFWNVINVINPCKSRRISDSWGAKQEEWVVHAWLMDNMVNPMLSTISASNCLASHKIVSLHRSSNKHQQTPSGSRISNLGPHLFSLDLTFPYFSNLLVCGWETLGNSFYRSSFHRE